MALLSQKIRDRFLATPDKSATLESLMENEKGEKKRVATEGLLWLVRYVAFVRGLRDLRSISYKLLPSRGLKFTQVALKRNQANKQEELSESFTEAYGQTLKKHHSFVVKPIFSVSLRDIAGLKLCL